MAVVVLVQDASPWGNVPAIRPSIWHRLKKKCRTKYGFWSSVLTDTAVDTFQCLSSHSQSKGTTTYDAPAYMK